MTEFKLTDKQEEQRLLASSEARHILAYGGSRSGKTFGFTRCVSARAIMAPESRHGVFRLHNVDVKQAIMMDTFPTMMKLCFPEVDYEINKSDQFAKFANDAEIWFGGLDDKERVEKILGKEYATIYPNECSQIPYPSITTLRTRLAQNATKSNGKKLVLKAYYDLNPVGKKHWSYSEFHLMQNPVDKQPMPVGSRAYLQMNPMDNPNLPPEYIEELQSLPLQDRLRFLSGEYLSDVPNSLWPSQRVDSTRVSVAPKLMRIIVAVDPSGSDGTGSGADYQGIVVVGLGEDGHAYVLEDASVDMSPAGWGRKVIEMYGKWGADCIVAEANFGGAMVESTIRAHDRSAKVKLVRASRGKHVRAEPIAALYEETPGKPATAHHVGVFEDLEDQLGQFTTEGYQGAGSPDRADALVWAMTELMLGDNQKAGMLVKSTNRRAA